MIASGEWEPRIPRPSMLTPEQLAESSRRNEIRLELTRGARGFELPAASGPRPYSIRERKDLTELLRSMLDHPRWETYVEWRNLKDVVRQDIGEDSWAELMDEIGEDLDMDSEGVNSIRSYADSGPSAEA